MSKAFGKHNQLTFVNGSYSEPIDAANLNEMERMHEITDNFLARNSIDFSKWKNYFFHRNCKQVETFQDNTDWAAGASTTLSDDATNKFIGNNSVRLTENDNTASYVSADRSISSVDLTTFNDGSVSDNDDCIAFSFYISDYTKLNTIILNIGTDSSNHYWVAYSGFTSNGWKTLYPKKSVFTLTGSASWSNITYIRVRWYSNASASGEYVSPQLISLFRKDPNYDGYFNPFQKYYGTTTGWINTHSISNDPIILFYDEVKLDIGIYRSESNAGTYTPYGLRLETNIISFIGKFEFICKHASQGPCIQWEYDTSNRLEAYITSDQLTIRQFYGGGTASTVVSLDNGLVYNERYQMYVEKDGDTFRAILFKDGEMEKTLEYETSINSEYGGDVYFGMPYNIALSSGMLTNFMISNTEIIKQDSWDTPKVVIKQEDEDRTNDTLSADSELFVNLPPNKILEIHTFYIIDGSSNTPDIRTDFSTTGTVQLIGAKHPIGPGNTITSVYNAEVSRSIARTLFSSYQTFGLAVTGYTSAQEIILVKTGITGGKLSLRWAQDTNDASTITMIAGSYMKVTEVKT